MQLDPCNAESFGRHAWLGTLVAHQAVATPRHVPFLARRFAAAGDEELQLCDEIAAQVVSLAAEDLPAYLEGYDFICDIQKREEIHFRRHNAYRLKTLQQATNEVYGDQPYMQKYMRGLLMTQVFWSNHTASIGFYLNEFLRANPDNYDLLEIGPGHGLLFSRAVSDPRARSVSGWDLSPTSVSESREAMRRLGGGRSFSLEVRNLLDYEGAEESFDAVVFSEVLEHLEDPGSALRAIRAVMRPGARLYVNVPVNSPAPDHLFLLRSPEEALAFVKEHDFAIERAGYFPATNYNLDAARKHALTISVCLVARKTDAPS